MKCELGSRATVFDQNTARNQKPKVSGQCYILIYSIMCLLLLSDITRHCSIICFPLFIVTYFLKTNITVLIYLYRGNHALHQLMTELGEKTTTTTNKKKKKKKNKKK